MSDKEKKRKNDDEIVNEEYDETLEEPMADEENKQEEADAGQESEKELTETERLQAELDKAKADLAKEKNDYLFLRAEFDNFRKRTLKEKSELLINGGERAFKGLLPVIDDFERAITALATTDDIASLKEGITLIYNKFNKYLSDNGIKKIDSKDADFNTDYHEAMTLFPVDEDEKRGKVIDVIEEGYTMNDKVIRHAKVVVGQ
ncbi:MAG: nucleotide exchange factor GrpE [Muribaculaceae bacterium]|nr:nucleotide exchange factor GrpE [Muribaculaceae bacterium]